MKKDIDMETVLRLVDAGYSASRIADKLNVSVRFVKGSLAKTYPEAREKLAHNGTIRTPAMRPGGVNLKRIDWTVYRLTEPKTGELKWDAGDVAGATENIGAYRAD